jgi:hypothetical protein
MKIQVWQNDDEFEVVEVDEKFGQELKKHWTEFGTKYYPNSFDPNDMPSFTKEHFNRLKKSWDYRNSPAYAKGTKKLQVLFAKLREYRQNAVKNNTSPETARK